MRQAHSRATAPTGRARARQLMDRVVSRQAVQSMVRTPVARWLRSALRWRSVHSSWLKQHSELKLHRGSVMHPLDGRLPQDVAAANAEIVLGTLDELGIPYTEVRTATLIRRTVAVSARHRAQLLAGLAARYGDQAVYAAALVEYGFDEDSGEAIAQQTGLLSRQHRPVGALGSAITAAGVVRIWKFYLDHPSELVLAQGYGCDIEFWHESPNDDVRWTAPRVNIAGKVFASADVAFLPQKRRAVEAPPSVFDLRMIDEVDFPIDVVYTWVDSGDPKWRRKFESHRGRTLPDEFHEQASGDQRFRSRDELRYSLRSLSMYAPWVRHVYIVTDDQVPDFIDFDRNGITLVDHSEIAKVPGALPVFNSSAIISWLHRVPGMSEHFIYMNDDVFIGRGVSPSHFYTPGGLAKVFPSNNRRPFGKASANDEPHINITRNIRALLENEFGRSISRSVKHTPHAQLVSVQNEMEKRFPDAYDRTSRSRFRHHDDIAADQLFHYYAQLTGRAIVAGIRYAYVNIGDERTMPELQRLLETRGREVFCLNDAPEDDVRPMTDSTVRGFLNAYYPVPSKWERPLV